MDDGPGFEADLADLEHCAHESLRTASEAMDEVLARWPAEETVLRGPGSRSGTEMVAALLGAVDALHEQQVAARDAVEASRLALVEIATTYREADRRGGDRDGR